LKALNNPKNIDQLNEKLAQNSEKKNSGHNEEFTDQKFKQISTSPIDIQAP
jgi:hypothetical protein